MAGNVGEFQITQGFLLVSAIIMTIPSIMIFLGTILMGGAWAYYIFYGTAEILLTGLIVWHAWKWPEQDA
jgi:hypothetical protein